MKFKILTQIYLTLTLFLSVLIRLCHYGQRYSDFRGKITEDRCTLMAVYMNVMQDEMSNLNGMGVNSSLTQYLLYNRCINKCKQRWIRKSLSGSNAMNGITAPWRRIFIGLI